MKHSLSLRLAVQANGHKGGARSRALPVAAFPARPTERQRAPKAKPAPQSIQSMLMEVWVLFILVDTTEILIYMTQI